jgi:hypothetical protein
MGVAFLTPLPLYILLIAKKIHSSVKSKSQKEQEKEYKRIENEKSGDVDEDNLMRV